MLRCLGMHACSLLIDCRKIVVLMTFCAFCVLSFSYENARCLRSSILVYEMLECKRLFFPETVLCYCLQRMPQGFGLSPGVFLFLLFIASEVLTELFSPLSEMFVVTSFSFLTCRISWPHVFSQ